jgi:MerR family transcriptional regulator, mercuric resistance operon regulatory protein
MAGPETFSIGGLSSRSGVNVETVRYYERIGLLAKPPRTSGGYRLYRPADADRLAFIRRTRDLGFTLDDVRRLLDLADGRSRSCRRVKDIAATHLADVRAKLSDLHRMERVLADLVDACADGTLPACPLLETLTHGSTGA